MKLTSLSLLVIPSLLAAGCMRDRDSSDLDSAESSLDSHESVEAEGNVMMEAVDGADAIGLAAATADQVATTIAANIEARWPSGCVTATATGASVNVVYDNCTGLRRRLNVSGELDLAITVDLTGIGIHGTSDSLRVNGADLVVDANARLTRSGDERILDVTTTGSGIGPRGRAIEHAGDYRIRANPTTACRSIEGSWSTSLTGPRGTGERGNDVDVERCADTVGRLQGAGGRALAPGADISERMQVERAVYRLHAMLGPSIFS